MDDHIIIYAVVGLVVLLLLRMIVSLWRRTRRARAPVDKDSEPKPDQLILPAAGPYLEALGAAEGPRSYPLTRPKNLIGRADHADIRIDKSFARWESVSREHAWIEHRDGRTIVEDKSSTNGITVNGRRTRRNVLKDGWRLEIGAVAFVYHASREAGAQ
jgi:pSer/pThr/pTyr-binding forkhead associated (FHA) protein